MARAIERLSQIQRTLVSHPAPAETSEKIWKPRDEPFNAAPPVKVNPDHLK
jgi:hypothetical protein